MRKSFSIPDLRKVNASSVSSGKARDAARFQGHRIIPASTRPLHTDNTESSGRRYDRLAPPSSVSQSTPMNLRRVGGKPPLGKQADQLLRKSQKSFNFHLPAAIADVDRVGLNTNNLAAKAGKHAESCGNGHAGGTDLNGLIVEGKSQHKGVSPMDLSMSSIQRCGTTGRGGAGSYQRKQSLQPQATSRARGFALKSNSKQCTNRRAVQIPSSNRSADAHQAVITSTTQMTRIPHQMGALASNNRKPNSKIPIRSLRLEGTPAAKISDGDIPSYVPEDDSDTFVPQKRDPETCRQIKKLMSMRDVFRTTSGKSKTSRPISAARKEKENGNGKPYSRGNYLTPPKPTGQKKTVKLSREPVSRSPKLQTIRMSRKVKKASPDTTGKALACPASEARETGDDKPIASRQRQPTAFEESKGRLHEWVFPKTKSPKKVSVPLADDASPNRTTKAGAVDPSTVCSEMFTSAVGQCVDGHAESVIETILQSFPKVSETESMKIEDLVTSGDSKFDSHAIPVKETRTVSPYENFRTGHATLNNTVVEITKPFAMAKEGTVSECLPHQTEGDRTILRRKMTPKKKLTPNELDEKNSLGNSESCRNQKSPRKIVKDINLNRSRSVDDLRIGRPRKTRARKIISNRLKASSLPIPVKKSSGLESVETKGSSSSTKTCPAKLSKVSLTADKKTKGKTIRRNSPTPKRTLGKKTNSKEHPPRAKRKTAEKSDVSKTRNSFVASCPNKKDQVQKQINSVPRNRPSPVGEKKKKKAPSSAKSKRNSKTDQPIKSEKKHYATLPFTPGEVNNDETAKQFRLQFRIFAKFGDRRNSGQMISMNNTIKWLKQANVIRGRKVTRNDVEIFFIHATQRRRSLSMADFANFLRTLVKEKKLAFTSVVDSLINCGEPRFSPTDMVIDPATKTGDKEQTAINRFAEPLFPPTVKHSTQTAYKKSAAGRQLRKMMKMGKTVEKSSRDDSEPQSTIPFPIPPSYLLQSTTDMSTHSSGTSRSKATTSNTGRTSGTSDTTPSGSSSTGLLLSRRKKKSKPKRRGSSPTDRNTISRQRPNPLASGKTNTKLSKSIQRPAAGGLTTKKAVVATTKLRKSPSANYSSKAHRESTSRTAASGMKSKDDSLLSPSKLLDSIGASTKTKPGLSLGGAGEMKSISNDDGPILIPKSTYARSSDIQTSDSSGELAISAQQREEDIKTMVRLN